MFKNFLTTSLLLTAFSSLLSREVDVQLQLQVGNKVGETQVRVNSKEFTQLSMDGESLGFEIRLANEEEKENEMFETNPTNNKKTIADFFRIGEKLRIDKGANLNGFKFEKELAITFLAVKKIA